MSGETKGQDKLHSVNPEAFELRRRLDAIDLCSNGIYPHVCDEEEVDERDGTGEPTLWKRLVAIFI